MKEVVTEGEELLPHRTSQSNLCNEENDQPNLEVRAQIMPIRKKSSCLSELPVVPAE
jgi:non-structural maintenance of chromosomes element 4